MLESRLVGYDFAEPLPLKVTSGDPWDWVPYRDSRPDKATVTYVRRKLKDDREAVRCLMHVFPDWHPWAP